ncbi:RNA polymerase subunit sigma-70 [Mycobacterium paraense]|uniref:RNA polymerase sigma factor n=2 Tax=Mycobacterium paraense TaxID=767916 RepID=A0ABX3VHJ8_9MYCO|nr:RNA polymerase subunit sigma-70 [Mycobacterium paraense]ORW35457.1 RNA polymerase subunit sigma-70 [Mycobacterium paraense]
MRCDVAREALSARLDGERPQVLAQQVDAHLESCRGCRTWLIGAAVQTRRLSSIEPGEGPDLVGKIMASLDQQSPAYHRSMRWLRSRYRRWGLIGVGLFQVAIAAAQISGIDFGMVSSHMHGAMSGEHLMHESTAWLLALGLAMIAAGIWPATAIGVAAITGVYSVALLSYVVVDAFAGEVTATRIASHMPLLLGLVFALLVAREHVRTRRPRASGEDADYPDVPSEAPSGRRHRHLWPINRTAPHPTAASTTTGRRLAAPAQRRWLAMTASSDDEAVTELALAAARGNERALEAFIKATQQDVWRFVTYLSDAGSADDLTQETFLRAIGAIERFSGRSSARTWLLAIARRVVADHIRHAQSRPRTAAGADPDHFLSGDRHARGFEDLVEVTALIANLTTEQREALLLTQLLGLPYADAAAVCGCPVGTIRSRVARARDALLADMEREDLTG